MKHYAIVLGVSEYSCAQSLPPCANDAKLMADFLRATGKYELWNYRIMLQSMRQ